MGIQKHFCGLFAAFATLISLTQCAPVGSTSGELGLVNSPVPVDENSGQSAEVPVENDPVESNVPPAHPNFKLDICSKLNFKGVSWASSMSDFDKNAMALALNISGSFEGHSGWSNLTNNFDGQGVSLGLLNQNLGQGSLQPLMINLASKFPAEFSAAFPGSKSTSVKAMLSKWKGATVASVENEFYDPRWERDESELDDVRFVEPFLTAKNQASVDWAVANIYSGSNFKADWKTALTKMASTPGYVSQQILAANFIHDKARRYMDLYDFKQLRAYLFFFDIVVQNGGINSEIQNKYFDHIKKNPGLPEGARMLALLEFRLTKVIPRFVEDVRSRKTAIIMGTGTVHGAKRDFEKEFCAALRQEYLDPSLPGT